MRHLLFLVHDKGGRLQRSWSEPVMECDREMIERLKRACAARGVRLTMTLIDGGLEDAIQEMETRIRW